MKVMYSVLAVGAVLIAHLTQEVPATAPVMTLVSVSDSGAYFVYEYEVSNDSASNTSISGVVLDVSDPDGSTDSILAATGDFLNTGTFGSIPFDPYVPVGPSSPSGWNTILGQGARLSWHAPVRGFHETDSVPPGGTLGGFVVRSPYLPEVRDFEGWPIWGDCCAQPDTIEDNGHPGREEFATQGRTVGPGVAPSEMGLDVLQAQLNAVCTDPLWITSTTLCDRFAEGLRSAATRLATGDREGARTALRSVEQSLRDAFDGGAGLTENAYRMLTANVRFVRESLTPPSRARSGSRSSRRSRRSRSRPPRQRQAGRRSARRVRR